jgi:hypothetical protein
VLTIVNPGDIDVEVGVTGASAVPITPQIVTVPAGEVANVNLHRFSRGAERYLVAVQSESSQGIVAADLEIWERAVNTTGLASALGVGHEARGWSFARAVAGTESTVQIAVATRGAETARVRVRVYRDGEIVAEGSERDFEVPPGAPVLLELPRPLRANDAIELIADRVITAERVITTDTGITRSAGIPSDR